MTDHTFSNAASNPAPVPTEPSRFIKFLREFVRSTSGMVALTFLCLLILAAILAPWIAPQNPYDLMQLDIMDGGLAPGSQSMAGQTYWLGTDDQGRDILSGILYGLRISLLVGLGSAALAAVIGTSVGIVAGYVGGKVEALVMRLVDLQLSFPAILTALMILAALGKGVLNVTLAIIIVEWATYARVARGAVLVQRKREYVEAAESLAIPSWSIVFRHLLPNCLPPLIVVATVQVASAISLEATLSFLGLGVPVTEPSLGLLISNGNKYLLSGSYWMTVFPGLALFVIIVALNVVGDRLRDLLNPRNAS